MREATKHTPGPWTNNYMPSSGFGCGYGKSQIIDSKGRALAGIAALAPDDGSPMYEGGGLSQATLDQLEANARLIAAAPGLLAALKAIERIPYSLNDSERCEIGRLARAAIAKALGTISTLAEVEE